MSVDQHAQKKPTILIVDDNSISLRIFGHILSDQSYHIVEAHDGQIALELFDAIKPDLVLLDVMMPGINGFEVCKQIKSNPENEHIPVIFLSARNEVSDIVTGFESGGIDYLSKPYNKSELIVRIKTHLDFKLTRDELIHTSNHLVELNELKNRLFAIIGHDLRSPLSNLKMTLDFIHRKIINPLSPDFETTINELSKSTDEMFGLLENLFGWARSQSGTLEVVPEAFNMNEMVKSVLDIFKERLQEKEISVLNQIDSAIFIWADQSMIKAVLKNLISNAIKYSYRKGQVILSSELAENMVQTSITDFGVGIDSERQSQVFSASKQVKTYGTENETGSGIGLMLCKDFIEKNSGSIQIVSKVGQGSTFIFSLPIPPIS